MNEEMNTGCFPGMAQSRRLTVGSKDTLSWSLLAFLAHLPGLSQVYPTLLAAEWSFPLIFSPSVISAPALALISTYSWMSLKGTSLAKLLLRAPHLFSQLPVWSSHWYLQVNVPHP